VLEEKGYMMIDKPWKDLRLRILNLTPEGFKALRDFLSKLKEVEGSIENSE